MNETSERTKWVRVFAVLFALIGAVLQIAVGGAWFVVVVVAVMVLMSSVAEDNPPSA